MIRMLAPLAAAAAALAAPAAHAGPVRPYSAAALAAAQRAGQPVLVDVHADWCPTCRAQAPVIAEISRDKAFAGLVILRLDFDAQAAERRALRVQKQSTLIVWNGTAERGRSTGVTDRAQIRALAASALR